MKIRQSIVKLINKLGLRNYAKDIYRSINYQTKIKLNGKIFKTLILYGAKCKVNEPWMTEILKEIFAFKKGAFLDVGVNLGQTLLVVKSIDLYREYIGFEPNPSCVFYAEELIRINKFENINLFPVGLFKENSILKLDLYDDNITNSGGSIQENFWEFLNIEPQRSLNVPVFILKK